MNPKRIIHLIQTLNTGGAEHVLLKTLPLLDSGQEHIIITLKEPGELAPQFKQSGIRVLSLNSNGLIDLFRHRKLYNFVSDLDPDLVITHLFHADVAGRFLLQKRSGPKVISSIVSTYNFNRYWPARLFEKLTRSMAYHYFANSQAVKDFYVANIKVKANKITVIPNGIDLEKFRQAKDKKFILELGLDPEELIISCVANLAENKGHKYLLEAFENVYSEYKKINLLIIGEGTKRDSLNGQIKDYQSKDKIHFLGRRHDIPEILGSTDIFVLPTLFEGLSNAILEAMAAKCAVITTDIPENRVMITHKQTGWLVPPKDVLALSQALRMLIHDKPVRNLLGNNAQKFIENNFNLKTIAHKFGQEINKHARSS